MKRILSIIMFSALLMCSAMGQIKSHTWDMGPLTWNDFQHKTTLNGHRSFLEYYMGIEPSRKKIDGVLYVRPSAYAFVSPEYSWADTAQRTPALLRYNQAAFGLMEVYRRRLERRLSTADLFVDEQQVLDNTMRQLNEDIDRLESETAQGDDSSALGQWERDIARQLDSLHPLDIYSHTDAPFRWGMAVSCGFSGVGGNLHRYFSNGMGLGFYFDMGVRRHFLTFGFSFAGSRCRDTVYDIHSTPGNDQDLWTGDRLAVLDLFAAYGFSVLDNARCRLTPFVGYGLVGYFFTPEGDGSSFGPSTGCLHAGVDFNMHFSNQVYKFPFSLAGYNASHDCASVNIKVFGTYGRLGNVVGTPSGFTFNVQLGFSIMNGKAKMK